MQNLQTTQPVQNTNDTTKTLDSTPTVHECLVAMVSHVIERYEDDLLVIDKKLIEKNPEEQFIHITRDNGTHLFWVARAVIDNTPIPYCFGHKAPLDIYRDAITILQDKELCTSSSTGIEEIYIHYNGSSLKKITRQQSIDVLYRAWEKAYSDYHGRTLN